MLWYLIAFSELNPMSSQLPSLFDDDIFSLVQSLLLWQCTCTYYCHKMRKLSNSHFAFFVIFSAFQSSFKWKENFFLEWDECVLTWFVWIYTLYIHIHVVHSIKCCGFSVFCLSNTYYYLKFSSNSLNAIVM